MKVNVQLLCPVSAMVDTETGVVESVHVWDELIGDQPTGVHHNEYVPASATAEIRAALRGGVALGNTIFDPLPITNIHVWRALEVLADPDVVWPAWEFGP